MNSQARIAARRLQRLETLLRELRELLAHFQATPVARDPGTDLENKPFVGPLLDLVAEQFGVKRQDLFRRDRLHRYVWPRQVAQYLVRKHANLTCNQTAELFGVNHATISNNCRVVDGLIGSQRIYADQVNQILAKIPPLKL